MYLFDNAVQPANLVPNKHEDTTLAKVLHIMSECSLIRGWPPVWERLSRTDRKFIDTISEAIDNVVAEMSDCGSATIEISIGGNWSNGLDLDTAWIKIRDNATGMQLDRLEKCLAMGELANATPNSLHEHGMGMKTMLVSLGKRADSLKYIATKTVNSPHGYRFAYCDHENPSRPFGEIPVKYDYDTFGANEHGTEFYIEGLANSGIYKRPQDYVTHIVEQLGFKYARVLAGDTLHQNQLTIILRLCDADATLLDPKFEWNIAPVWPRYRNGERPCIDQLAFGGPSETEDDEPWRAHLDFGRAAQEEEYETAGLEPPGSKQPLYPFKRKISVVMHGKVITELTVKPFGGNHHSNVYVPYSGVVTLVRGFTTTHEKNGIMDDGNWQALRAAVWSKIKGLITEWAGEHAASEESKKQRERTLRDAYADHLRIALPGAENQPHVATEYPVEGSGGKIDILFFSDEKAEHGFVIEMKAEEANGLDVMQTFGYMFMCQKANKKRGRLVAPSFSTGAHSVARKLEQEYAITIELCPLDAVGLANVSD